MSWAPATDLEAEGREITSADQNGLMKNVFIIPV